MLGENFQTVGTWEYWIGRLFEASWQGAIFLLIAWLVVVGVKGLSATARCWIWRVAFLKFFVVLFVVGSIELPLLESTADPYSISASPTDQAMSPGRSVFPVESPSGGVEVTERSEFLSADIPTRESVVIPSRPEGFGSRFSWAALLGWGWALGFMASLILVLWQIRFAYRISNSAFEVDDSQVSLLYRMVCAQLRLSSPPELAGSAHIESPILVGVFRPVILVPDSMLRIYDKHELKMALAHELAHAKRRDLLWNWLFIAVRTVFFFHPLVWMTQKRVSLDQELACDQMAFTVTNATLEQYGNLLVKFSAATTPVAVNNLATVGAAGSFETLKVRILEMKKYRNPANLSSKWMSAVVVAAICLLAVPITLVAQESGNSTEKSGEPSVESSLNSWTQSGSSHSSSNFRSTESGSQSENGNTKRRTANVSVSDNGLEESMKVTWNANGAITIVFRSNASGTKKNKKYRVKSMDELEQANKDAYDFYKKHFKTNQESVSTTAGGLSANSQNEGPSSVPSVGRMSRNPFWPEKNFRGGDERPEPEITGAGTSSSSSASSSASSGSSSRSSNGIDESNQASRSRSRKRNSAMDSHRRMVEHLKRLIEKESDSRSKEALQTTLEHLLRSSTDKNPGKYGNSMNIID